MIDLLAKMAVGFEVLCVITILELLMTGHSFASLFICILAGTYLYEKRRYENNHKHLL